MVVGWVGLAFGVGQVLGLWTPLFAQPNIVIKTINEPEDKHTDQSKGSLKAEHSDKTQSGKKQ